MNRQPYDIWEVTDGKTSYDIQFPIRVQLHGCYAGFETREKAEKFIEAVKRNRKEI